MQILKYKIRKNDQVIVLKGKERGKTGKVIRLIPDKAMVVIEKLNIAKQHTRPSAKNRQGGIIEKENPLSISNVMLICEKCKGPVKVAKKYLDNGKKVRFCKKCGEVLDR